MKKMIDVFLKVGSCLILVTTMLMTAMVIAQEGEEKGEQQTEAAVGQSTSSAIPAAKGLTITTDGVTTSGEDISDAEMPTEDNMGAAYVCTLNDQQRRIEIDLLNAPDPVPCEVNYYKDTEVPGAKTTLWTAQNDALYCEGQAKSFVEKLESMSWSCSSN